MSTRYVFSCVNSNFNARQSVKTIRPKFFVRISMKFIIMGVSQKSSWKYVMRQMLTSLGTLKFEKIRLKSFSTLTWTAREVRTNERLSSVKTLPIFNFRIFGSPGNDLLQQMVPLSDH